MTLVLHVFKLQQWPWFQNQNYTVLTVIQRQVNRVVTPCNRAVQLETRQKKCSEASSLGDNSISCFQTITLIFTDLKTKVDVVERTQISSDPTSSHRIIVHSHSPSTKQWTQGRCSGVVLAMHARNYQHIKRYFTHLELWNNTAHTKGTHYHYLHTHSKLVENSGRVKTDCQQSKWAKN